MHPPFPATMAAVTIIIHEWVPMGFFIPTFMGNCRLYDQAIVIPVAVMAPVAVIHSKEGFVVKE